MIEQVTTQEEQRAKLLAAATLAEIHAGQLVASLKAFVEEASHHCQTTHSSFFRHDPTLEFVRRGLVEMVEKPTGFTISEAVQRIEAFVERAG